MEYSKRAIIALFALCIAMIAFACAMIVWAFLRPDRVLVSIDTVLMTASGLLTGGLLGYLLKSARENPEKIRAQHKLDMAKLERELAEVRAGASYTIDDILEEVDNHEY